MSDLERYKGGDMDKVMPLDLIIATAIHVREQNARIAEVEQRMDMVESTAAESRQWMTLVGFVIRYHVQVDTDVRSMSALGTKVSQWHRQTGRHYRAKDAQHAVYGSVNSYQVTHLCDFFNDGVYSWDREMFGEDHL